MKLDSYVIWDLIQALSQVERHAQRGRREHPADPIRLEILALAERSTVPLRPSGIAQALSISSPSVTRHVQALEGTGSVTAVGDATDGRSYQLVITDKGRHELQAVRDGLVNVFRDLLDDWSAEDVSQLAALLTRLNETISAAQTTAPARSKNRWQATESARPADDPQ